MPSLPARASRFVFTLSLLLLLGGVTALRATNPPEIEDTDPSPYHAALLAYKSGKYDEARTAIDAAEKANPDDLTTEILKARILTEQHQFSEGAKILRHFLTSEHPLEVQLALGDLLLRERNFDAAADLYTQALKNKPGDPDIILKFIYTRVSVSDFVTAGKYASQLKPFDSASEPLDPHHPGNPSYYFAKAAIAQATGKFEEAQEDIQTVRTLYGITITNHYLKTYLQVMTLPDKSPGATMLPPPATNAPPADQHP